MNKKLLNEKIVLIGAGSASFTKGLVSDFISKGWTGEIALVDIDEEALSIMVSLVQKMLDLGGSNIRLSASVHRREALKGASVVICTIAVGGREAWLQDVLVPRKYGIYQPVGDTALPGGTSRALRMIPAMVDIARDVIDLAPNALFFNYANPMSVICRAIRKATGAEVIGLCHGVIDMARGIAGRLGTTLDQMKYTAVGMNHFTWFTEVEVNGEDAMTRLKNLAAEKLGEGMDVESLGRYFAEAGDSDEQHELSLGWPLLWELTRLFGAFPAPGDRHIVEFFPQMFCRERAYYGKTLGVDCYSLERCIEGGQASFDEMKNLATSTDPLPDSFMDKASGEHEQVCDIIESIRLSLDRVYNANLPNTGQIPNLPNDVIVECPVIANADGLQPIQTREISSALTGTLATRFQWAEVTVEAALEGDRDKFVQALLLDGAVNSLETAYRLADDFLEIHQAYLPQFS
jgi:alpha-galactosidase